MAYAIQWIRSLIFTIQMYIMLLVIGLGGLPFALVNRKYVYKTVHAYCNWVMWTASWMVGLKTEFRGEVPDEEILIAGKHMGFLDILMIASKAKRPKYIMKASLKYAPIIGLYGKLTGSVPVNRGQRSKAIRSMMAAVSAGDDPIKLVYLSSTKKPVNGCYPLPVMSASFGSGLAFIKNLGLQLLNFCR
jgi:1-acyl-sn-glycerol-3-phosphate acyltransferase